MYICHEYIQIYLSNALIFFLHFLKSFWAEISTLSSLFLSTFLYMFLILTTEGYEKQSHMFLDIHITMIKWKNIPHPLFCSEEKKSGALVSSSSSGPSGSASSPSPSAFSPFSGSSFYNSDMIQNIVQCNYNAVTSYQILIKDTA